MVCKRVTLYVKIVLKKVTCQQKAGEFSIWAMLVKLMSWVILKYQCLLALMSAVIVQHTNVQINLLSLVHRNYGRKLSLRNEMQLQMRSIAKCAKQIMNGNNARYHRGEIFRKGILIETGVWMCTFVRNI